MDEEIFQDEEIKEQYEKIKDHLSKEEFLEKMNELEEEYKETSFVNEIDMAKMIVSPYLDEKNETLSTKDEHVIDKIDKLEVGAQNITLIGKVMGISNVKKFTSRKGKDGKLCNLEFADDTGLIRVTLWTDNIKHLKKFNEGDVIKITHMEARDGYNGIELQMQPRSQVQVLNADDYPTFPEYKEPITLIEDINPDETVNIIGRIIRIPEIRKYESKGKKGKVVSLEIQDESGKISYTLWNKDVDLIEELGLEEGDSVKILRAQARERNGEISLSHFGGKIVKGDYEVPEFEETILKIGEAQELNDVNILGIITKIQDTITFERKDGSEGYVKSIEVADDTGSIRVTLWNNDTKKEFTKGDIIKIVGGNIEFDEWSTSGYRLNTNWNTSFTINPKCNPELLETLNEIKSRMKPLTIEEIQEFEEDGEEIDVIGRLISLDDTREFQREDSSVGLVRSADFADETGSTRISFWDDKAKLNLKIGEALSLENVRTRLGMEDVELNVGKTSRVIELNEDEVGNLPPFNQLEEMIYEFKKIDELDEDDRKIRVVARILDIQDIVEFQKTDGSPGKVRSMDLADETGSIKASLWDDKTDIQGFKIGDAVKIDDPRVTFREDRLELSIGGRSDLISPSTEETEMLPTFNELKDIIYQLKTIDELEEDDINIRVSGSLTDIYSEKLLLMKCPHCKNNVEVNEDDEYTCEFCGEEFDKPNYTLMLPSKFEDDTGEISITFFGKLVEELLDMSEEEIISIVEDGDDLTLLETKIEDLTTLTLDLIVDVSYDEYNEAIRLNPKRILSKEL